MSQDQFISALELTSGSAIEIFAKNYWPDRFLSVLKTERLRDMLFSAALFAPTLSEQQAELRLLLAVAHNYVLEAIAHDNT